MSESSLQTPLPAGTPHNKAAQAENLKLAFWLYLASEVVIFSTLIATFIVFRLHHPEVVDAVRHESNILLVTLNTFLLLTSSWAMVMGLRDIQNDNHDGFKKWFGLMCALGATFVVLQYVEYTELGHMGVALFNQGNEFDGFGMRFYAPTAFHGVHVIIGVLWGAWIARRNRLYGKENYSGVEVFGLYWHFVDVVWVLLFTLLYLV
jgi:heme/copper-type cytochrome/quinol oxidase subunit 3